VNVPGAFGELDRLRAENERLMALVNAQETKVRELEETLASCVRLGVSLRSVLATYKRGEEPTAEQMKELE
jgi:hypothetical protein